MAKMKKLGNYVRKNINLPVNIVEDINAYSELIGLDFTSTCIMLLSLQLDLFKKDSIDLIK